jgi:type I restriction enzyme S subunit
MLFSPGSASGPYEAIREAPHLADVKAFLEDLWARFSPYTNKKHFLSEIRKEDSFYQRLWELHLGCILLNQGYQLTTVGNKGPDFLITVDDKKIWIEATVPMAGKKDDAVPPLQWNSFVAQEVPEEKIILRFTSAIDEKWKKYKKYLEDGIIKHDDVYVIAVGWNSLPDTLLSHSETES